MIRIEGPGFPQRQALRRRADQIDHQTARLRERIADQVAGVLGVDGRQHIVRHEGIKGVPGTLAKIKRGEQNERGEHHPATGLAKAYGVRFGNEHAEGFYSHDDDAGDAGDIA